MPSEYITSERFIHDELIRRAERSVNHIPNLWRKLGKIPPTALSWPAAAVKTDDGEEVDGVISMELPIEESDRSHALRELVKRTKPYGLLLIEQHGKHEVRALFETHHGSRSWSLPIRRHGDVNVLGTPIVKEDTESIGILWRPRSGQS